MSAAVEAGPSSLEEIGTSEYRGLCALLYRWTGIHLTDAKRYLVLNRLGPHLSAIGLPDWRGYLQRLEKAGARSPEARTFINSLTTNKTSFFREPKHFEFLRDRVVKEALARAVDGGPRRLRIWSAAASTGEEPYTLALVLREACDPHLGWNVRILATDLDTDVLSLASAATYADAALADVPPERRGRWFSPSDDGPGRSVVSAELRRMITFGQANLTAEPFPVRGQFDAIFCRNVMIYFDRPTQIRVVANLLRQLAPGGYLIVGHAESLVGFPMALEAVDVGVYRHPARDAVGTPPPIADQTPGGERAPRSAATTASARAPGGRRARPLPAPPRGRGRRLVLPRDLPSERIILGKYVARKDPALVGTLLGSCVSVCLHDPIARIGGLNHFMLPRGDTETAGLARFGVHAMELLINLMLELGASRSRLVAKVFGAASVNPSLDPTVSLANATFAREFLLREGLAVKADRLGGTRPQEVWMRTDTGQVFHRYVERSKAAALVKPEVEVWTAAPSAGGSAGAESDVELF